MDWSKKTQKQKAAVFDFMGIPHTFKPRAERTTKPPEDGGEAPVIKAVSELLAMHPGVLLAVRQNSGSLPYKNRKGDFVPVWFYKLLEPKDVTLTDFWGLVEGDLGRPRMYALEAKRPDWNPAHKFTDREMRQQRFIVLVREAGGVGGFVRNVDEAKAVLHG